MQKNEKMLRKFQSNWKLLSKEDKEYISSKSQCRLSYLQMLSSTKDDNIKVSNDTLYDLVVFTNEMIDNAKEQTA